MSPYPPGMGRRDKIRAGIIEPHAHEHEFEPDELRSPVIEDGRAIFFTECIYAEGRYGDGWSCEEERQWSIEQVSLTRLRDNQPDVTYLADEFDHFLHLANIEAGLIDAEMNGKTVEVDPDPDLGRVVVETDNWRAIYEA